MKMPTLIAATLAAALPCASPAQSPDAQAFADTVRQVSRHIGEMDVSVEAAHVEVADNLRFEPYQQFEEMFARDDVVYLMRHGPTDWSKLDAKDVAPTDCANQRVMSSEGKDSMRDLGVLLASNDILPARIVVSEWCRNQQTLEHLTEGFDLVDPQIARDMPVETDAGLNLLLSLQGSKDVGALRERVSAWNGDPGREGPLLIVTHYTNIEELTQFRVFEGEILVLDPKRDNQVLGYIRLRSANPDVGHFADALASPLLADDEALEMVSRYYDALRLGDREELASIVSDRWVAHGTSQLGDVETVDGFLAEVRNVTDGLEDARFDAGEVYVTQDVITVVGTLTGRHTGAIYGIAPTGREVSFADIAAHRVEDGRIAETWHMADRLSLVRQIAGSAD